MKTLVEVVISFFRYRCRKTYRIGLFARISKSTILRGYNCVGRNTVLSNCQMGLGSYVCNNCEFSKTIIGNYCSIGSSVRLVVGSHPTKDYISTHPAFFSKENGATCFSFVFQNKYEEFRLVDNIYHCVVGNDVWIGNNVLVMGGVTIGNGAIIGAGAVVTKDIPPYAIAVGVPAKVISYRFPKEQIEAIEASEWWNWDFDFVKQSVSAFINFESFEKIAKSKSAN